MSVCFAKGFKPVIGTVLAFGSGLHIMLYGTPGFAAEMKLPVSHSVASLCGRPIASSPRNLLRVTRKGEMVCVGADSTGYCEGPASNKCRSGIGTEETVLRDVGEERINEPRLSMSGSITAGMSILGSPWYALSPTGSIHLQNDLRANNTFLKYRTLFDANGSYAGIASGEAKHRTINISHAGLEEEEYLTAAFYLLQHAMFDRNSVQGLHLQQLYGGGCGYAVLNRNGVNIGIPVTIDYVRQSFVKLPGNINPTVGTIQSFVGPGIGTNIAYTRFARFVFFGSAVVSPSWNLHELYAADVATGVERMISRRFGVSVETVYEYIDNPQETYSRGSTQINLSAVYSFP